ncbi:MAG: glucodextranase DOMON-like domain-containing protein [Spirochaetia bacterium]
MVKGMRSSALLIAAVLIAATLTGCATRTAARRPEEGVIYLNLMWHQHQPQYYADPDTGIITRPWVRMHSQKSYYDMAALVAEYPDVQVTFNLTPVLLRQIDQFLAGAKDIYWVLAEKPAGSLTEEDKRFILQRFFDANWNNIIGRFPRYRELLQKRGDGSTESIERAMESFTEQDYRDLQIWFNLAWFDPSFQKDEPLASLIAQGRDFTEDQKPAVFDTAYAIMEKVVEIHRDLQDRGQIEVTTTPFAHPILPLIYNSDLVEVNDPAAEVPPRFSYPNDAIGHLQKSVEIYTEKFGRAPRGLWPGEGAVAQEIVRIVANAGFSWMASGEQVLAKSIGLDGFTRDENDVIREADELYRPYYAVDRDGQRIAVFFRDLRISDLIGFEYSGTPASQAVNDFVGRIESIKARLDASGAEGPHIVSVILDGENAWEHYPLDGIEFLSSLYAALEGHPYIRTVTPSGYLELYPEQRELEYLWPGSWFSPDYATWIGEPEETLGWTYLERVRRHLAKYDIQKREETTTEQLEAALESMYLAEGSDWFWWYGADQDSGVDEYFDEGFRALLRQVYVALGDDVPQFLSVPIIPERPVQPAQAPQGALDVAIDGVPSPGEWDDAGYVLVSGGAMARAEEQVSALYYGFTPNALVFRIGGRTQWDAFSSSSITVYFSLPGQEFSSAVTLGGTVLGFRCGFAVEVALSSPTATLYLVDRFGEWDSGQPLDSVAVAGRTVELAASFDLIGTPQPGDAVSVKTTLSDASGEIALVPASGPVRMIIPDLGDAQAVLAITDPTGDDYGPGTYTYPTDVVFVPGSYDIESFSVAHNERNLVFTFKVGAQIGNPWGSAIGLSVQTFDIYIDVDPGAGTGASELLEGRNARLQAGDGWDLAVWVEGWSQKILVPNAEGNPVELPGNPVRAIVDGANGTITILVPKSAIAEAAGIQADSLAPESWAYAGMVLSQEGFPSAGVRRVRDVNPTSSQWRLGGGSGERADTRILDIAIPADEAVSQEDALSGGPIPLIRGGM